MYNENKGVTAVREKHKGMKRVWHATTNSFKGLAAAFTREAAVRQETLVFSILIPFAVFADVTLVERILLIMTLGIVFIAELLNTAIEVLADRVSTETHVLIGQCKDIASAAVFISILLAAGVWTSILFLV